jgi:hypothetical protein
MKKKSLTFIILLSTACAYAQSWSTELGLNYVNTAPLGSMSRNIRSGNGVSTDFAMVSPSRRLALGVELSYTQYGHDKSEQLYDLDDGTTATMEVTVNNSFANVLLIGKLFLVTQGKLIPYISAKVGWSEFRTDLNIYDPDDWDHCEPVETDILQKDGTMIGTFGAGFRLDLSTMFKRMDSEILYLDFNTNLTQGGTVNYMNTDAPHHPSHTNSDVMADFRNTQTQVVHEHHVGYLYSSPIQLVDFRLGVTFRINR